MRLRYLLDTNIVSEPQKPEPNKKVMDQLALHEGEVGIPSIVLQEMSYGIEKLGNGERRRRLEWYLYEVILPTMRIIDYDQEAALWHGKEKARLLAQGQPKAMADSQIAAIAVVNQLILVTRNVQDFSHFQNLSIENWYD